MSQCHRCRLRRVDSRSHSSDGRPSMTFSPRPKHQKPPQEATIPPISSTLSAQNPRRSPQRD
ncbi:hypothetical protein EI94DRAFT_1736227 [Lactarius quietus]|nr:hypothetical protein EI94DRAFT_1736227 [Lactarius quietus]